MAGSMVHMCIAMELMEMLNNCSENKKITGFVYNSGDTKYVYKTDENTPLLADEEAKALFLFGNVAPDNIMSRKGYTRDMKMHTHFRDDIKDSEFGRRENLKVFHKRFYEFAYKTLGIRENRELGKKVIEIGDAEGTENQTLGIYEDRDSGNPNLKIKSDRDSGNQSLGIYEDRDSGNPNLKIKSDRDSGNLVLGMNDTEDSDNQTPGIEPDSTRSFADSPLAPLYLGYLTHTITDEKFMLSIRPYFFECMRRKGLTTANPSDIPEIIRLFTLDTDAVDYYLSKTKPYIPLMKKYLREAPSCCVEGYITKEEMEKSREWMLNRYFGEELSGLKASYVTEQHMERFIRRVLNHIRRNLSLVPA